MNLEIPIPPGVHVSQRDMDALREAMPAIVSLFLQRHELLLQRRRAEVVDFMLKDVPMRAIDTRMANLQARAMERVYQGAEWLTAEEVGAHGAHGTVNLSAAAHRWKDKGLVFALRKDRRDMYPRYAFTEDFKPVPAMKDVLQEFGSASPARIAAWFESTSAFLGGKRPRELIATKPERVILAARDAASAEREPA